MGVGTYFCVFYFKNTEGTQYRDILFLGEGGELCGYLSLLLCWDFFCYKHFQREKEAYFLVTKKKKKYKIQE